jgi:hypothetical protein
MRLCIKRANEVVYLNGTVSSRSVACPNQLKKCNKYTCVQQDEDCPLTNVVLVKYDGTRPGAQPTGFTTVREQSSPFVSASGQQYSVYVQRGSADDDADLINNVTAEVGGAPCYSPIENPSRSGNRSFSQEKANRHGCLKYGHETKYSLLLDSQSEYDTYVQNKITEVLPDKFTDLLKKNGDQLFFYLRRTVPMIDIGKCQLSTPRRISNVQNLISSCYQFLVTSFLIFIFFGVCSTIFYVILLCMGDRVGSKIIGVTTVFCFTLASLILVLQYFILQDRWSSATRIIDDYFELCSPIDGVYQKVVQQTKSEAMQAVDEIRSISIVSLAVGAGTILFHLVFLYTVLRPKREDESPLIIEGSANRNTAGGQIGGNPRSFL